MHIASVNVRFYETDMMGIAHHSIPSSNRCNLVGYDE